MTTGSPPSMTAMTELVVPRSIPTVFGICQLSSRWDGFDSKLNTFDLLPRIRRGKTKPPLSLVPMAIYELDPVDRIAIAAVGEPGQRRFFLQATGSGRTLTLGCDKGQIQALVVRLRQMLETQQIEKPQEAAPATDADAPAGGSGEPEWQIGEMGLGYHE